MNHRVARFLLLFAALWLPLQTMAAITMPLCRHVQEQAAEAMEQAATGMEAHCHESEAAAPVSHDAGCDNCQVCHMASAGFMPSAAMPSGVMPAGNVYALPSVAAPRSHITEPPQHPPRQSA